MILVTGGSGLVGQELIKQLLAQGKPVTAVYHHTPLQEDIAAHVKLTACDINDPAGLSIAMEGIQQVYHCAAMVSFNPKRREQLFHINVEGTANMVNAALEAGVEKFVHVSSVAALGRIRKDNTINETMNWSAETSNSAYGESKFRGEMEVWRGVAEGLNAVIVNPAMILGAGDWKKGSSEIFKSVYDEFGWYSNGVTGFVDVRDVARAMILLMDSEICSERFILSGHNKSYQEVFNLIAENFGKKPPTKKVTPLLAAVVWRLEKIKSWFTQKDPLITSETAKTAMAIANYDNSKILEALPGFQFTALEKTISDTCAALKKINSL